MITLPASGQLASEAASTLQEQGFVVVPGPLAPGRMEEVSRAYGAAETSAAGDEIKIGSTTTRVSDFVNRGREFDDVYTFPPLLDACRRVIGRPFKLSSFHSRTLRPAMPGQRLHVDVKHGSVDWPLLAFILMVDEFTPDNGATRFVPGSHLSPMAPESSLSDLQADLPGQVLGCGSAGSLLIFHGSVWHGHTANKSGKPRRSLQGAFIPRNGASATNFAAHMQPSTRARLSPVAAYVLDL
jgi:hypothetical protein